MSFVPDLDAYFARIGYAGPRQASREVLDAIVLRHVCTIPFENVDVLLGRGIDIDPAAVERKLVHARRGGYCFEQNGYLLHVLGALGFSVRPLSARVRVGRTREEQAPRTHVFVGIDLEGQALLADVGVGGLSPTCSLRLDVEQEQATPHEPRRLLREGAWSGALRDPDARIYHQARIGDEWRDVAELTLEQMPQIDRVIGNWYTSAHPSSRFKQVLMVARATETGRVTLLDYELTVRGRDGVAQVTQLASDEAVLEALEAHFGIALPAGTKLIPSARG